MSRTATRCEHDPRLVRALRAWLLWGSVAVLLLPAARAQTDVLGWLPLYLVAMPASALWALRRFALPHWVAPARRRAPQARRLASASRRGRGAMRSQQPWVRASAG